jgi:hypothetical protein
VAAVALRAVLAEVAVVLVMADATFLGELHRAGRLPMAGGALQFGVRPKQCEVRLPRMVEYP